MDYVIEYVAWILIGMNQYEENEDFASRNSGGQYGSRSRRDAEERLGQANARNKLGYWRPRC
jgi:hypothetical protein